MTAGGPDDGAPARSYDYAGREGVEHVSWEQFAALAARLAEQLAPLSVEAVVGTARAGLFPAAQVAMMLRRMLYPISLSRRVDDEVRFEVPVWRVDVSVEVAGKVVAVVDEIADTGRTLATAAEQTRTLGAARVVTAALVSHSWATPAPDLTALVTDAFVVFPWNREVYVDEKWQDDPEVAAALELLRRR